MGKATQTRASVPDHVLRKQRELKEIVTKLGDEDQGAAMSRELVAVLGTARATRSSPKLEACETKVRSRLKEIDEISGDFEPHVNRDLLIIVFLGLGRIDRKLRLDACALLQLHGSSEAAGAVCVAFPGFIEAIGG